MTSGWWQMISGQVTFGSTGSKSVYFGQNVNEMVFFRGDNSGYANSTHQFNDDGTVASLVVRSGGVKVLEFAVTGGWGTPILSFNVTYASASYPFRVLGQ